MADEAPSLTPLQAAARIAALRKQVVDLNFEIAQLSPIVERLEADRPHRGEGVRVKRTTVRNVDSAAAQRDFPANERPDFYATVPAKVVFDLSAFKKGAKELGVLSDYHVISYRTSIEIEAEFYSDGQVDDIDPDFS